MVFQSVSQAQASSEAMAEGSQRRNVFIHPTALVESNDVGDETKVWAFAHIMAGARVGRRCVVGDHAFIESGVVIGDDATIKNASLLFDGVTIADGVFIGPGVQFTNDARPRSPRAKFAMDRYGTRDWLLPTCVGTGASIGAGAIILPGVTIGTFSMVAAGSVVSRDVAPHTVVKGTPAREHGLICRCGTELRTFSRLSQRTVPPCAKCGLYSIP